MAISLIRTTESHTGSTGSASEASFTFAVGQAGDSPKGIVVFVMQGGANGSNQGYISSVTYGGSALAAVSGAEARDTSTELGLVRAYFLGSSVPSGAQSVVVNRTNNTTVMYAVAFLLGGARDTWVVGTPALQQENGTIAAQTVNDGFTSGKTSIALAAAYSGDNTPAPDAATSMTTAGQLSGSYAYSFGSAYETTPTYGSRSRGCSQTTSDDRAHVVLLVTDELQAVAQTLEPTYALREAMAASLTPEYELREPVAGTLQPSYDVQQLGLTAVTSPLSVSYDVRETVASTIEPTYAVRQTVAQTLTPAYDLRQLAAQTVSPAYAVLQLWFGRQTISAYAASGSGNHIVGSVYTLSESAVVTKLSVYIGNGASATNIKGVIYAMDASGGTRPGTLMGVTQEYALGASLANGWVDLTFSTPVELSAADYFLGYAWGANGTTINVFRDQYVETVYGGYNNDTYSDGVADPCAAMTWRQWGMSLYASYYRIARVAQTLTPSYEVIQHVAQSLTPTYNLASRVTQTLTPTYNVREAIAQTLTPAYAMRELAAATLAAGYALRQAVAQSLSASYAIRQLAGSELAAVYSLRQAVRSRLVPAYHILAVTRYDSADVGPRPWPANAALRYRRPTQRDVTAPGKWRWDHER